eukprot:GABV01001813.1.p3 GENE.GABV01001813.1~~GABV01001813.1.p3  ORF type:complete len:116 (-),score=28.77 GABV01001813.1:246-593(-)
MIMQQIKIHGSVKKAAQALNVSTKSLYRIRGWSRWTEMSQQELDERVSSAKLVYADGGIRTVQGQLRAEGAIVRWTDVRGAVARVDPEGIGTLFSSEFSLQVDPANPKNACLRYQ